MEPHIRRAQAQIASRLDLELFPKRVTSIDDDEAEVAAADIVEDRYDLDRLTWHGNWGFLQVRRKPLRQVLRWTMVYGDSARIWELRPEWFQTKKHGVIQITPTSGTLGSLPALRSGGSFLPMIAVGPRSRPVPGVHRLTYLAGFEAGALPEDIVDAIAKTACINVLNVVGDSLLAGIASQSVSIDGLSESFNTTQSAENALYSARIRMYREELKTEIQRLRQRYHGVTMRVA